MDYFPTFMNVKGKKVLVIGGTEDSLYKVRLLRKTTAEIILHGDVTDPTLKCWIADGFVRHVAEPVCQSDLKNVSFAYIGVDDLSVRDAAIALFEHNRLPYSVIDNKALSSFITPAIVDRDPVVVAIGTEGTGPIIARNIKARIEAELHPLTGIVAKVAGLFRPKVEQLPHGTPRRLFWQRYLDEVVPAVVDASPENPEDHLNAGLEHLLATHHQPAVLNSNASIRVVNIKNRSADLLTRQSLTWLHDADIVFHHDTAPNEILELSRREAGKHVYSTEHLGHEETATLLNASRAGRSVVVLVSSNELPFNEAVALSIGVKVEHAAYIKDDVNVTVGNITNHRKPAQWLKAAS